MRAGIYCRVSSQRQRREATIETQSAVNNAYCERVGMKVAREYRDDGLSGTVEFTARPAGRQLLSDAQAGLIDVVVVYDTSRLGRDDYAVITPLTVAFLRRLGLEIHTPSGPLQDSPEGNLMLTIHSGLDAFYRADLARRVADGKRRALSEGRYIGQGVPYGYCVKDSRIVLDATPVPGTDTSPADVMRKIFHFVGDEQRSCNYIVDYLNALGVPPPGMFAIKAKKWSKWLDSSISRLLRNKIYCGIYHVSIHGERYEIPVPPLVDRELFDRANTQLFNNRRFSKDPFHVYTVRDVLYCGQCGAKYHGHSCMPKPYSRRYFSYYCYGKKFGCAAPNIRAERVEKLVWKDVLEVSSSRDALADRVASKVRAIKSVGAGDEESLARLRGAREGKSSERDLILGLFRRGQIRQDALEKQLAQIDSEEAGIQAQIRIITERQEVAERATAAIQSLQDTIDSLSGILSPNTPREEQREVINNLIERVTALGRDSFHIEYKF